MGYTNTIILAILAVVFFGGFYGANQLGESVRQAQEAMETRNQKCIEAGGVPVSLYVYIKGIGKGYVCVKISEKLEIEK